MIVQSGLDRLVSGGVAQLKGKRVGVLANQASVDSELRHIVDLLVSAPEVALIRILAPEHGLRGSAQDMVAVDDSVDPRTNIPVVSLYGSSPQSLHPREEHVRDLDLLVIDLQDVGSRYYTFTQSMMFAMEVCGRCGVKVLVLDRPNPIGGDIIEGALLEKEFRSFCGMHTVANRHGLTIGEFAHLVKKGFGEGENRTQGIPCELEVLPLSGWKREMSFHNTLLPWIYPSPNMPTIETALVYPGSCLFEATNLSEGRGTTKPFELLGAPYIDSAHWIEQTLNQGESCSGAILRPVSFVPQFQKWQHKVCHGVQIHVSDQKTFKPLRLALSLIGAAATLYPDEFSWRQEPYEFVKDLSPIDLLYGNFRFRKAIETGASLTSVFSEMDKFEQWYREERKEFLLYERP